MRKLTNSNSQFKKAIQKLPLGVSSNFRYWGADKTLYIKKGKGGKIWDLDNNEYIDYRLAYGPIILGYQDKRVDEAARSGMDIGGVFALATELEYEIAKRINKMVKSAELIRFSNSGTEAVMAALRVARAYTGKDGHVILEGGYHGVFSEVMWYSEIEDWDPKTGNPDLLPFGEGIPKVTKKLNYTVPINNANAVEELFKQSAHDIGAFLVEPIMGNCCSITANQQYMEDVRYLCSKHEILMIIDEVKTGFRVARGGAQELYNIEADLCTFAKAIGNGYPVAVLAGKEEIMRNIGGDEGVVHGGTFTGHSVSLSAAAKTLEIIDETDALKTIENYGLKLQKGMSKILSERSIVHDFSGHPSMMGLFFAEQAPNDYRGWLNSDYQFYDTLAPNLHEMGILVEPDSREPWFLCESHDMGCLKETLDKFEQAVDITRDELDL